MDNVVKIGENTPCGMVNEELIDMINGLLDRAKSGEIVGMAYAATDGDDRQINGWESGGHNLLLSSAIAILNVQFQGQFIAE